MLWHTLVQGVAAAFVALGIYLYLLDGWEDDFIIVAIGLAMSIFGFLGVRLYRRYAERRLNGLEEEYVALRGS